MTDRLHRYLESLERRPHIFDRGQVANAISDFGIPVETWLLDFHDRYAGFVQPIGLDEAVLGILHENSKWLGPNGIDGDNDPDDWMLCCADAHPSHGYQFTSDKLFIGGCGSSFDTIMDRKALWHEFASTGQIQYIVAHPNSIDEIAWRLIEETSATIDRSSDETEKLYTADQLLIRITAGGTSQIATTACTIPKKIAKLGTMLHRLPFWPGQ
jgi:hypothetical protein